MSQQRRDGRRNGQQQQTGQAHDRDRGGARPAKGTKSREDQDNEFDSETSRMILDSDLDAATKEHLLSYLNKDHVLANLSDAQLHEFKWLLRNRVLQILASHPPKRSVLQGAVRQATFDDARRRETSLTDSQVREIRSIQKLIESRISRAEQGLQLQELSTMRQEQIRRTESDDDEEGAF